MTADEDWSFASVLSSLIRDMHPPDRESYSYREIARGVQDKTGIKMSPTTVYELASGKRQKPSLRDAQGLAAFFGVPLETFTDPQVAAQIREQIANLKQHRDQATLAQNPEVMELALRAVSLSDTGRAAVDNLIRALETHEHQDAGSRPRRRRDHRAER
ncbi:helix-turn-helix domain-containing protein [Prauserella muralis]|uniref:helix-turn-helix domain-containing protein n=1 Tax=Prauserella muralis TaxID=588067 RepID=UPI000DD4A5BC|nr:helix-turn-helix transcriptional regulator [Prauserella muralis]TWE11156.1 hypothetical protein FHX69_7375 [Prauserella muralis]